MRANERRQSIWQTLCSRRHETVANLAEEHNVTTRTIRHDLSIITLSYPIETVRGRYGGGVKLADWYQPTSRTLCPEQLRLLKKIATSLEGDELTVLNSIFSQFAPY